MSLKVALVQYDIVWENVDANLKRLTALLEDLDKDVDLVVLPEMFATGFSMDSQYIVQEMDGDVVVWMKKMAFRTGAAMLGTQAVSEGNRNYNRALFATPSGNVYYYDKRHLFSPGRENQHYAQGTGRKVFVYKGVRILPQICYDLRFPVWSRNKSDYDVAVYMANWPAARSKVWDTLIQARAIENQCYVVAVNRIGSGGGIDYGGGSKVINFKGDVVMDVQTGRDVVGYYDLDLGALTAFIKKFPTLKDADDFNIG